MIENILDGIEVRLGENMQKNTHAQPPKNTQTNAPNPFLVILANSIGYNGFAFANVLRLPYFSIKKKAVKNREINRDKILQFPLNGQSEYSCAVTPQIRQAGNRLSGLAGTAYASLLA